MDTLIDNRNFPTEMQDYKEPEKPMNIPWRAIFMIILGIIILGFLVYLVFFKKPTAEIISPDLETVSIEEVQGDLIFMDSTTPADSFEVKDQKREPFFYN